MNNLENLPEVKEELARRKKTKEDATATVYLVPESLSQEELYKRIVKLSNETLESFGDREEGIIEFAFIYTSDNLEMTFTRDSRKGHAIELYSKTPYLAEAEGKKLSERLSDSLGIEFILKKE